LTLAGLVDAPIEEQVARATQNVSRNSSPSELRITDHGLIDVERFRQAPLFVET